MNQPTQDQIERANHCEKATHELLSMDTSGYDRLEHINHARELLMVRDQGIALAIEVMGDDVDQMADTFMGELIRDSIDKHLRIAELMPDYSGYHATPGKR